MARVLDLLFDFDSNGYVQHGKEHGEWKKGKQNEIITEKKTIKEKKTHKSIFLDARLK